MTLILLVTAAFALVAYGVSALVGLALYQGRDAMERLAPKAQARLYFLLACLPFVAATAVTLAALAPSFGWIADHCTITVDAHSHPHICVDHHEASWPAFPALALVALITIRTALVFGRRLLALGKSLMVQRRLQAVSEASNRSQVRVLDVPTIEAFVLGLLWPTLYLSKPLTNGPQRVHLNAVLAHEQAHLSRRDPLRRFVAGLGLAFHLPLIASVIARRHAMAQEMAADEVAAAALGSREQLAQALVALAKARVLPQLALAFAASSIEARVLRLLRDGRAFDLPNIKAIAIGLVLALALVAASADHIHHGIELILGAIGA